jgi:hypothetical protein
MTGGAKKRSSKKASKRRSKKGSKKMTGGGKKKRSSKKGSKRGKKLSGGANAGFEAFLELKKKVASALGVPNGPKAGAAAGAAKRDAAEKHPNMSSVEVMKEAFKLFEANKDKYAKFAK